MSQARTRREVFFVIGSLHVGGTEVHLTHIARELVRRGFAVTVYNLTGDGILGPKLAKAGVKVIGPPISYTSERLRLLKFVLFGLSALKLYFIFLFRHPAIVHFFLPQAYITGTLLAKSAGLKPLIMSRRSLNCYQRNHPWLGRVERRLHKHMQVILGNSRSVVRQLADEEDVEGEKLGLIYNGVDLAAFDTPLKRQDNRADLKLPPESFVLILAANLIPYKGHADLLDALALIADDMPTDWQLLLAGRDDGIGDSLKQRANELGLSQNVVFLGPRSDLPELLRIADLALLTSHEEGFSNVILEAMAAGLPVIATDVGGNAEAVVHEETGYIVPARAPEALAAAILRLARDTASLKRMGRAGRRRVETNFSLQGCADRYQDLYDAVASERPLPETLRWDGAESVS